MTEETSNGAAWAALVAAAVGCAAFGILADLAEAFKGVSGALNLYNPAGDLTGKSTGAVVIWGVAWLVLHLSWRNKEIRRTGMMAGAVVVLMLFALVATFPPVFGLLTRR